MSQGISARGPSALAERLLVPRGVARSIDCPLARSAAEYRPASPPLTRSLLMRRDGGVTWSRAKRAATEGKKRLRR